MKHTKLFEQFLNEAANEPVKDKNAEMQDKISDGRNKTIELRNALQELGNEDEPNVIKTAIMQLNLEKQNLINQMLRIDNTILSYKDKLVKQKSIEKQSAEKKKAKEEKLKKMEAIAKERASTAKERASKINRPE